MDYAPKVYNKWPNLLIIINMMKGLHFKLIKLNLHSLLPTQIVNWTRLGFHVDIRKGFGYYHRVMFGSPIPVMKTYFHVELNKALTNMDTPRGIFLQKLTVVNGLVVHCHLRHLMSLMDMKLSFDSY